MIEQLSETIRRSIERGTDTIAAAAKRAAFAGAALGASVALLLIAAGITIGARL